MGGQAADDEAWDGFAACMARTKSPGTGAPFREHLERDGERHIDRMNPFGRQDVDRCGHRRRHGRHQHSIGAVLQFLDNQSRTSASSISASGGAKPGPSALPVNASGEAPQQRIAGKLFQQPRLNGILRPQARPGPHDETHSGKRQDRQDFAKLRGSPGSRP